MDYLHAPLRHTPTQHLQFMEFEFGHLPTSFQPYLRSGRTGCSLPLITNTPGGLFAGRRGSSFTYTPAGTLTDTPGLAVKGVRVTYVVIVTVQFLGARV